MPSVCSWLLVTVWVLERLCPHVLGACRSQGQPPKPVRQVSGELCLTVSKSWDPQSKQSGKHLMTSVSVSRRVDVAAMLLHGAACTSLRQEHLVSPPWQQPVALMGEQSLCCHHSPALQPSCQVCPCVTRAGEDAFRFSRAFGSGWLICCPH